MESVGDILASVAGIAVGGFVVTVLAAMAPESWRSWARRWRGVLSAGAMLLLAAVIISFGVAILVADDHLGAATLQDARVMGIFFICAGPVPLLFGAIAYREHPPR